MQDIESILNPDRLLSVKEIRKEPLQVPYQKGLYAWYFKENPQQIPADYLNACHHYNGKKLLYIGIAPKAAQYKNTDLHTRIVGCHVKGTAKNSTLRFTLGALQGLPLKGDGKELLNYWLEKNAFVTWVENETPWLLEDKILQSISCPLNIRGNKGHGFVSRLKEIRKIARNDR